MMGPNIRCKMLGRKKKRGVGVGSRGWGQKRKGEEKGNTVRTSLRYSIGGSVEGMECCGVLSQCLLSSMEVFPLT